MPALSSILYYRHWLGCVYLWLKSSISVLCMKILRSPYNVLILRSPLMWSVNERMVFFLCSNKFHHHSFPAFWDTELRTNTCPKRCLAENWNSEWLFIQVINKLDTFKILLFRHNNKRYQIILVVDIGFLTFRMNSNGTIIKWNISYEKFGYDIYHIISTVYSCESDIWAFATIVKNMLKMWPKCSAFIRYSIELFNTQLLLKNEDVRANKMKNV